MKTVVVFALFSSLFCPHFTDACCFLKRNNNYLPSLQEKIKHKKHNYELKLLSFFSLQLLINRWKIEGVDAKLEFKLFVSNCLLLLPCRIYEFVAKFWAVAFVLREL